MDQRTATADRAVALKALERLSALDIDAIGPLLDEDVVLEMPYARGGKPFTVSGRAAVLDVLGGAPTHFEQFRVAPHEIWECPQRNAVIVEATSVGRYKAGGFYENRYGFVFLLRNGRIATWREYANPNAMKG